ncbi:hypothetical protein [Puniceibacterium sp. IMCC21224]|uniref:hypothetical protein n=1 Tax=Puniceibacterium sp. IMCC21224 TaxID=1618204 RepID=UPI00064DB675|nr:hypothetical protein [Puniceibacterium sp. IMCC21224]KMK67406.1 hypothetical protein IMCC21224_112275 [Puniceibacterium sp. IMCC21224]
MTQIDELERRITAALDRIAYGVETLDPAPVPTPEPEVAPQADPEEMAALRDALQEERLANAQLEERVRAIREKQENTVAELHEQVGSQREALNRIDTELQRLRRANDMLRDTNQEMRAALEENVGEPHLINKAMLAELEGLRAAQAADVAENRAVLQAMEPLLTAATGYAPSEEDI